MHGKENRLVIDNNFPRKVVFQDTKIQVLRRVRNVDDATANFSYFHLELNAVVVYLALAFRAISEPNKS